MPDRFHTSETTVWFRSDWAPAVAQKSGLNRPEAVAKTQSLMAV